MKCDAQNKPAMVKFSLQLSGSLLYGGGIDGGTNEGINMEFLLNVDSSGLLVQAAGAAAHAFCLSISFRETKDS